MRVGIYLWGVHAGRKSHFQPRTQTHLHRRERVHVNDATSRQNHTLNWKSIHTHAHTHARNGIPGHGQQPSWLIQSHFDGFKHRWRGIQDASRTHSRSCAQRVRTCPEPRWRAAHSTDVLCETGRRRHNNMSNGLHTVWFPCGFTVVQMTCLDLTCQYQRQMAVNRLFQLI